jgi:hypothetical protein
MFLRFKYERSLARYFWLQRIFDEARWKQTFIRSAASGKLGSPNTFAAICTNGWSGMNDFRRVLHQGQDCEASCRTSLDPFQRSVAWIKKYR